MIDALVILMAIGFIVIYLWIIWVAIDARENLNKAIDRLIEDIRKSKKL